MTADLSTILALEVPLIVRLAERPISIGEVLRLTPGAILELEKNSEDELDVLINNKKIGHGLAVKIGENFGIEITEIENQAARVNAMGGSVSGNAPDDSADDQGADEEDLDALAAAMLAGQ